MKKKQEITKCNLLDLETLGCHYGNFLDDTLMNTFTDIVMDDGWVRPLAKTLPSPVSNFW